jgi:hypothetical protein
MSDIFSLSFTKSEKVEGSQKKKKITRIDLQQIHSIRYEKTL